MRRELTQRYCGEVPPAPRPPLAVGSPPPFALSLADGRGRDDAAQRGEFARGSSRGRARTKLGAPPHPRPTPRRSLTCARASLAGGGGRVPSGPDHQCPVLQRQRGGGGGPHQEGPRGSAARQVVLSCYTRNQHSSTTIQDDTGGPIQHKAYAKILIIGLSLSLRDQAGPQGLAARHSPPFA